MPTTDYSAIDSPDRSRTDTQTSSRVIVAKRLEKAGHSPDRLIRLRDGSKAPISHDIHPPEQVGTGDYGVYVEDGLVVVDIDSYWDDSVGLPKEIQRFQHTVSLNFWLSVEGRGMTLETRGTTFTARFPPGGKFLY